MPRRGKVIPLPSARRTPRPAGSEREFAEVHRCDQAEALVVKGLFESEGIPTLLRSLLVASVHPFSVGDQGEVVVLVPKDQLPRCRPLLIRLVRRPLPS
jgi:hypothetical protein